jgi:hypothetical protein
MSSTPDGTSGRDRQAEPDLRPTAGANDVYQLLCGLLGVWVGLLIAYPDPLLVVRLVQYAAGGPLPLTGEHFILLLTWIPGWGVAGLVVGAHVGRRLDQARRRRIRAKEPNSA